MVREVKTLISKRSTHQLQVSECGAEQLLLQLWVADQELAERHVDCLHQREERRRRWGGHYREEGRGGEHNTLAGKQHCHSLDTCERAPSKPFTKRRAI